MQSNCFQTFSGETKDPWALGDMQNNLPITQQQQQKHRKTPQEFLGDNANLVNLDQLVATTNKQGLY